MNQRPRRSIVRELQTIEQALAALTQQIAELQLLADAEPDVEP
jgi:hypothetical protein